MRAMTEAAGRRPWASRRLVDFLLPHRPSPRSSGDRAPPSGGGCAGSNPAGGTSRRPVRPCPAHYGGAVSPRLLSVNVGLPKDVRWRGRTVFTGVFKDPVAGPVRVGRLNLDGDGQGDLAGHGGEQRAVFVYQLGSYRYWERELGRDDLGYGRFG